MRTRQFNHGMHNIAGEIKDVGLNSPLLHSCLGNTSSFQGWALKAANTVSHGGHTYMRRGGLAKRECSWTRGEGGMTRLDVLYCTFLCFLHNPFPSYSPVANCT